MDEPTKGVTCKACGNTNVFRKDGNDVQVYWPGGMNIPAGWITLSYSKVQTLCNKCATVITVPTFEPEKAPAAVPA